MRVQLTTGGAGLARQQGMEDTLQVFLAVEKLIVKNKHLSLKRTRADRNAASAAPWLAGIITSSFQLCKDDMPESKNALLVCQKRKGVRDKEYARRIFSP